MKEHFFMYKHWLQSIRYLSHQTHLQHVCVWIYQWFIVTGFSGLSKIILRKDSYRNTTTAAAIVLYYDSNSWWCFGKKVKLTRCISFHWWHKNIFILAHTTATHDTSMARQVNESVLNGAITAKLHVKTDMFLKPTGSCNYSFWITNMIKVLYWLSQEFGKNIFLLKYFHFILFSILYLIYSSLLSGGTQCYDC